MELTSEQIRLLMMYEWLLDSNATLASERINLARAKTQLAKYGIRVVPVKVLEVEGSTLNITSVLVQV
ncbi:hypothetical protein KIN20_037180 [Parelaphostrongylus tenuis]|uniref:Uncharacterized protein n=1 Tax=Parelaphostrongylus tenuis TaxID=148309 RepID=A0AAD5RDX2_PARTN|nr:hypothetical protein KIN20_037180 [Parelaphostrongylus tenuis]